MPCTDEAFRCRLSAFSSPLHQIRIRMYVCPKCNAFVDQPQTRWWSGWRYCESGHVLYVLGLGPSLEQSFRKSWLKALARSLGFFCLVVLTFAMAPEAPPARLRGAIAPSMGFWVAVFYLFVGVILLRKARSWTVRAGAVQKLVTHARGRAYGFLAAVLCQLGIVIALLLAR